MEAVALVLTVAMVVPMPMVVVMAAMAAVAAAVARPTLEVPRASAVWMPRREAHTFKVRTAHLGVIAAHHQGYASQA